MSQNGRNGNGLSSLVLVLRGRVDESALAPAAIQTVYQERVDEIAGKMFDVYKGMNPAEKADAVKKAGLGMLVQDTNGDRHVTVSDQKIYEILMLDIATAHIAGATVPKIGEAIQEGVSAVKGAAAPAVIYEATEGRKLLQSGPTAGNYTASDTIESDLERGLAEMAHCTSVLAQVTNRLVEITNYTRTAEGVASKIKAGKLEDGIGGKKVISGGVEVYAARDRANDIFGVDIGSVSADLMESVMGGSQGAYQASPEERTPTQALALAAGNLHALGKAQMPIYATVARGAIGAKAAGVREVSEAVLDAIAAGAENGSAITDEAIGIRTALDRYAQKKATEAKLAPSGLGVFVRD